MRNEFYIGCTERQVCSATCIFGLSTKEISMNSEMYWIHNCLFGSIIFIGRKSYEGKQLEKLIEDKVELEVFNNFFDSLILPRISAEIVREYIKYEKEESFLEGKRFKILEIKNCLSLDY